MDRHNRTRAFDNPEYGLHGLFPSRIERSSGVNLQLCLHALDPLSFWLLGSLCVIGLLVFTALVLAHQAAILID